MSNSIESLTKLVQENPAEVAKLLQAFQTLLKSANLVETSQFPSEPLKIGAPSKDKLIQQLERDGVILSQFAKGVLDNPNYQISQAQTIPVAEVTGAALGFKDRFTYPQLVAALEKLGLELVPQDTAFYYKPEKAGWVTIATETIADKEGNPRVLGVSRGGSGQWVHDRFARSVYYWNADSRFLVRVAQQV